MHYIREQLLGITSLLLPCGSSGSKSIIGLGSKHLYPLSDLAELCFCYCYCLETSLELTKQANICLPLPLQFHYCNRCQVLFSHVFWESNSFPHSCNTNSLATELFPQSQGADPSQYWDASVRSLGIRSRESTLFMCPYWNCSWCLWIFRATFQFSKVLHQTDWMNKCNHGLGRKKIHRAEWLEIWYKYDVEMPKVHLKWWKIGSKSEFWNNLQNEDHFLGWWTPRLTTQHCFNL